MEDFSWTTLGLIIAVTLIMVLLTWLFVLLRHDRSPNQAEQLRSDQAVDSALLPLLAAYDQAIEQPSSENVFAIEQKLKDLLLVAVSFAGVDHDFKTLPKSLELTLKNLENLPADQAGIRQQLQQDCAQIRLYHQRIERILKRSPS